MIPRWPLRKSWRSFHDRLLLPGRCFQCFILPVLEYCSALWCSAADTHLKLLDRAVSAARFHRRSVALQCILNKIRSNPMHNINWSLPGPYVPVRVTRGSPVAHRYTYASPRCRTSQYRRTFIHPLSVPVERSNWPCIRWCGLAGFKSKANLLFALQDIFYTIFPFFFFSSIGWYCLAGVSELTGRISLSLRLALPTSFNNNNSNNNNNILLLIYLKFGH